MWSKVQIALVVIALVLLSLNSRAQSGVKDSIQIELQSRKEFLGEKRDSISMQEKHANHQMNNQEKVLDTYVSLLGLSTLAVLLVSVIYFYRRRKN